MFNYNVQANKAGEMPKGPQFTYSFYQLGTPLQIMGVVQLVVREDNGELLALADYRKGGVAAGYR